MERIGSDRGPNLDAVFSALADPTRRAILTRLSRGEVSAGDLAEPFAMSGPAVSKHLKVLERAGLITRRVDRQRRMARLDAARLAQAVGWLETFRDNWEGRLDALDGLLGELQGKGDEDT